MDTRTIDSNPMERRDPNCSKPTRRRGTVTGYRLSFLTSLALCAMVVTCLLQPTKAVGAQGDISTVAGGGGLLRPWGVTTDADGKVYIADWGGSQILKFDPATSTLTREVGNGLSGRFLGESAGPGPASEMTISPPNEVAVDSQGNIYFRFQGSIQKADPSKRRIHPELSRGWQAEGPHSSSTGRTTSTTVRATR